MGTLVAVFVVVVSLLGTRLLSVSQASTTTPTTVVSIEFDDGWESAYQAGALLASYDMAGTFFILSGFTGDPDFMTWSQLHTLADEGDEIAGHTIDHPVLTSLSTVEQEREICNDRVNLINEGFEPTDFAYPDGAYNSTTESIVQACGYDSARTVAGVEYNGTCTSNVGPTQAPSPCVDAETIPPLNPYATRTPATVSSTDTPASIESLVTQAQDNGGGWVQIVFHQICDGVCPGEGNPSGDDATPETLNAVLAWLQTQEPNGIAVEPVDQVIGGAFHPAVPGPPPPPPGTGAQLLQNPDLETNTAGGDVPDCFQAGGYGTNSPTFSWSPSGPPGSYGETIAMTSYASGDAELATLQDQGTCSPSVTSGQVYVAGVFYESTVPVTLQLWYRNTFGAWVYWTDGGPSPPSSTYVQATFQTPPVPAGATALSVGLSIAAVGSVTTGDYSLGTVGSTSPPSTVQNPLLEQSAGGIPTCWQEGGYGVNAPTFTLSPNGPAGGSAENITMSSLTSGDAKLVVAQTGPASCAPAITAGMQYQIGVSYESTVPTAIVAYYETSAGAWDYWSGGPNIAPASSWTPASWTTPPAPTGAVAISFGVALTSVGSLSTGDYSLTTVTPPSTLQNPLLEQPTGGVPTCWQEGGYGVNSPTFTLSPNGPAGGYAETITISSLTSGDAKLVVAQDGVLACAPVVAEGQQYQVGVSYESTVPTAFVAYDETSGGVWSYWASGPNIAPASSWTAASWTTPPAPAGAVAISFGVALTSVGSLSTGDYSFGPAPA